MKTAEALTADEPTTQVTESQQTVTVNPPLSDEALQLLDDKLRTAYANAGMAREWRWQCETAWRRTNFERRIQLMKFAGMDYIEIGMYSELGWMDIPYAPRHKLEAVFKHLAEWVWAHFQDERVRQPANMGAVS